MTINNNFDPYSFLSSQNFDLESPFLDLQSVNAESNINTLAMNPDENLSNLSGTNEILDIEFDKITSDFIFSDWEKANHLVQNNFEEQSRNDIYPYPILDLQNTSATDINLETVNTQEQHLIDEISFDLDVPDFKNADNKQLSNNDAVILTPKNIPKITIYEDQLLKIIKVLQNILNNSSVDYPLSLSKSQCLNADSIDKILNELISSNPRYINAESLLFAIEVILAVSKLKKKQATPEGLKYHYLTNTKSRCLTIIKQSKFEHSPLSNASDYSSNQSASNNEISEKFSLLSITKLKFLDFLEGLNYIRNCNTITYPFRLTTDSGYDIVDRNYINNLYETFKKTNSVQIHVEILLKVTTVILEHIGILKSQNIPIGLDEGYVYAVKSKCNRITKHAEYLKNVPYNKLQEIRSNGTTNTLSNNFKKKETEIIYPPIPNKFNFSSLNFNANPINSENDAFNFSTISTINTHYYSNAIPNIDFEPQPITPQTTFNEQEILLEEPSLDLDSMMLLNEINQNHLETERFEETHKTSRTENIEELNETSYGPQASSHKRQAEETTGLVAKKQRIIDVDSPQVNQNSAFKTSSNWQDFLKNINKA